MVKNTSVMWETQVQSLVWKVPWRKEWIPTPVFFLENPIDTGAWQATVQENQTPLSH